MITLRYYQTEARDAIWQYVRGNPACNPVACLPTGAGKTPLLAALCSDVIRWGGRVLCVAHVKELLQQAYGKLKSMLPDVEVGLYSAGLGKRQTGSPVTVAGIQSIYAKAEELGRIDVLIVDEAHLVPGDGDGMYLTLIRGLKLVNPHLIVIGLTATPYRTDNGLICGPEESRIFREICYEISVKRLIEEKYLSPLVSQLGTQVDTSRVTIRGGEFLSGPLEQVVNKQPVVLQACKELVAAADAGDRRSVLVFTCGVDHCQSVTKTLRSLGCDAEYLDGKTSSEDRARLIAEFQRGTLRYLVNVNVLTTGFDAPNVDLVALLRPTMSPGLYYQMVGRGLRTHPGKADCLVMDFGGNIDRHGPIDRIEAKAKEEREAAGKAPTKECPRCDKESPISARFCSCGFVFPVEGKEPHAGTADGKGIVSGQVTTETHNVQGVTYRDHEKKGRPDAPHTLQVTYQVGVNVFVPEWVCIEHDGWVQQKARAWWRERSNNPFPGSAREAEDIARAGGLRYPETITVKHVAGEKFSKITAYTWATEKPQAVSVEPEDDSFAIEAQGREPGDDGEPAYAGWRDETYSEEDIPF